MTIGRLVLRNVLRHPVRSALLMTFAALSLFVGCFLRSIVTTLSDAVRDAASNRLTVQSGLSLFAEVPSSYRDTIAGVEGVESVARWSWFAGIYRDPANFFPRMAVDMDVMFQQYPEIDLPEDQKKAVLEDRRGCLVGIGLAEKFGFRVGDSIPLIGTLYALPSGQPWEFTVRGIYRSKDAMFNEKILFLHWDYLEEVRRTLPDSPASLVTLYMVKVVPGADPVAVSQAIDARYAAGPTRTHTQTEAAFRAERIGTLGNVTGFLGWIGGAVFLAMLLSVANAMGIAASERARDIGVLKALGFRDGVAMRLLLLESVVLVGVGGVVGSVAARLTVPLFRRALAEMLPRYTVPLATVGLGCVVAVALGIVGALAPAIRMSRVNPVRVLREGA